MKKLLQFVDAYLLKSLVGITIAFTSLYPKLPSIHIVRTWVYIRLEDFLIALVVVVFLTQLIRKKVRLPWPVGFPVVLYWVSGLITFLFSLIFVGPVVINFFPHIAFLEYGRRIEYMILFFVGFASVRSIKDLRDYFIIICLTILGVLLYGFGQRYYLNLWAMFPAFFEKYSFCFPSFQTGNEEFAKGLPLCLPKEARIPSTFGGHYDLAAYLVLVLPILVGVFFSIKKKILKGSIAVLFMLSLIMLLFTASRVSFFSYLIGTTATLIFLKRKKWILPVFIISVALLLLFSQSTAKRLLETFRVVNVVTNNQGQVVGLAQNNLPSSLQKKISKTDSVVVEAPPPTQNLPEGSSFITLPQTSVATKNATVTTNVPTAESLRLKLANGGLEISTISGSFLIQKALVYDISFTTRFQAEWPNAWAAFMSYPVFGKGYSTITLATDNDFLRLLGESGIMGFVTFFSIFLVFGIFLGKMLPEIESSLVTTFAIGVAGGVIGLFANASLIDVFEASKVAEPLWLFLGIAVGGVTLYKKRPIAYMPIIKKVLSSHIFLVGYLLIAAFLVFGGGIGNFFVADDFVWLKWAATSSSHQFLSYFTNAQGFFYRPIDRIVLYFFYTFSSFQPNGYHVFSIIVHFLIGYGVYLLGLQFFKKKIWAWLLALTYIILPIHAEVLFWMATISNSLSTLFMVYALVAFVGYRQKKSGFLYLVSLLLSLFAAFSYELAIVLPLVLFVTDIYLSGFRFKIKSFVAYVPFVLAELLYLLARMRANVAPVGGDYSYNFAHLFPNAIGNFLGYLVTTFFGERALSYQMVLRDSLRTNALIVAGVMVIVLLGMAYYLFTMRTKLRKIAATPQVRLMLFGLLFAFVSLLPVLGLGNMTERYGYFSAIGFAFVFIGLVQVAAINHNRKIIWTGIVVGLLLLISWKTLIGNELAQWKKASDTTYMTLGYFRVEQEGLPQGSSLYFVNVPIRYGNAWIFPVGLPEGLWFIYRDPLLKVYQLKSVDEAKQLVKQNPSVAPAKDYIFQFNKNDELDLIR